MVHPYHRQGDIELRSKDRIILMADSWRLANASTVFEDMFEIPTPRFAPLPSSSETSETSASVLNSRDKTSQTSRTRPQAHTYIPSTDSPAQTVDLDYTALVLDYFLNLINVSKPSIPPSNFHNTLDLFDLCLTFDVRPLIRGVVSDRLMIQSHGRLWELFIWASKKNNILMAKEALRRMSNNTFLAYGKAARPRDAFGRYNAIEIGSEPGTGSGTGSGSGSVQRDWHPAVGEVEILRLVLKPVRVPTENGTRDSRDGVNINRNAADVFGITEDWTRVAEEFNP
ncbi:hypothetical protein IAT40_000910 [Kwoniella sp. CBS 6097]